jgi:hypothetical protein
MSNDACVTGSLCKFFNLRMVINTRINRRNGPSVKVGLAITVAISARTRVTYVTNILLETKTG